MRKELQKKINFRQIHQHAAWIILCGLTAAALAACQPQPAAPSSVPTAAPATHTATSLPSPTSTASQTPTTPPTITATPTVVPLITETPSFAETSTAAPEVAGATETTTAEAVIETPLEPTLEAPIDPLATLTAMALSDRPTKTPVIPTATKTNTPTTTPTVTPTPTPPLADVRITRPGLFSKIISPYRMEANVAVGEDGLVHINLIGEDARIITSQLLDYKNYINRKIWIAPWLEFNIAAAAETARLEVSVFDKFNRPMYLTSVDLILLSVGRNVITPAVIVQEPYLIRYPYPDQTIQGGTLWVSGLARPVNDSPVILEVFDEQNQSIAISAISVPAPTGDLSHTPFEVFIPYEVKAATPVRLVIRQESTGRIPGTVALTSMTLSLEP